MTRPTSLARIHFFEKIVHLPEWRESMAGTNEKPVVKILESLGFEDGKDFQRQYPIGEKFVMDFAFVNEQIALEVDGDSHNAKRQKSLDKKRDSYLRSNNWVPLRIKNDDLVSVYSHSFYKNLIKDVVLERREQYITGLLFPIDVPHYNEADYE